MTMMHIRAQSTRIRIKFAPLTFVCLLVFSSMGFAQETSHYDVVAEFIHELAETKNSQDVANSEMTETAKLKPAEKNQQTTSDIIRNGTRIKLKLQININSLKGMKLDKPFETLIPYLIEFNEAKYRLYEELTNIAKTFSAGSPQPGVDYSKLAARMPEITAELEYAEESIFKVTPMVFMLLIDQKPDSKNHLSHLIITKAEGKKFVDSLNNYFGSSMDKKNQNWTVSSASVLRTYFTKKGYKYSDEPWE